MQGAGGNAGPAGGSRERWGWALVCEKRNDLERDPGQVTGAEAHERAVDDYGIRPARGRIPSIDVFPMRLVLRQFTIHY